MDWREHGLGDQRTPLWLVLAVIAVIIVVSIYGCSSG